MVSGAIDVNQPQPRRRLSADGRRGQLLDTTIELLEEIGPQAVTMEGVAARAGVSKALGYRYFHNAEDVVIALYDREMTALRQRVCAALEGATGFEDAIRRSLTVWLDVLAQRGTVLAIMVQASPTSDPGAKYCRAFHEEVSQFYGERAAEHYGLTVTTATAGVSILISGLEGLVDSWVNRRMHRRELVDIYTMMCIASLEALADEPPLIGERQTRPSAATPVPSPEP